MLSRKKREEVGKEREENRWRRRGQEEEGGRERERERRGRLDVERKGREGKGLEGFSRRRRVV